MNNIGTVHWAGLLCESRQDLRRRDVAQYCLGIGGEGGFGYVLSGVEKSEMPDIKAPMYV